MSEEEMVDFLMNYIDAAVSHMPIVDKIAIIKRLGWRCDSCSQIMQYQKDYDEYMAKQPKD